MRQWTTPIVTLKCIYPQDSDGNYIDEQFETQNLVVTVDQDGTQVTKESRKSDDVEVKKLYMTDEGTTSLDPSEGVLCGVQVALYLSQTETGKFDVGNARAQIRYINYLGHADATKIYNVTIEETLYQGEITYGE